MTSYGEAGPQVGRRGGWAESLCCGAQWPSHERGAEWSTQSGLGRLGRVLIDGCRAAPQAWVIVPRIRRQALYESGSFHGSENSLLFYPR